MTSILLATIVQAALLATEAPAAPAPEAAETYAAARKTMAETGKPMVVMVSTDWCPPCQVMKKTILPRVRERGLLRKVAFAMVNPDRDKELAQKLIGGGPIPQLLMFRKTPKGWVRNELVGGQSVEKVEEFIKDGLVQQDSEKKASPAPSKKAKRPVERTAAHAEVSDDFESERT